MPQLVVEFLEKALEDTMHKSKISVSFIQFMSGMSNLGGCILFCTYNKLTDKAFIFDSYQITSGANNKMTLFGFIPVCS